MAWVESEVGTCPRPAGQRTPGCLLGLSSLGGGFSFLIGTFALAPVTVAFRPVGLREPKHT